MLRYSKVPNIDLPPICSPKFKPGPPSDEAQALSDRLFDTLTSYVCPFARIRTPTRENMASGTLAHQVFQK